MKLLQIITLIILINVINCEKWVNFISYSNRNCSGVHLTSVIKTNECIGASIYKCNQEQSSSTQFSNDNCENEYIHKTNKNNFCNNKGFTTSCFDSAILPKDSFIIASYKNGSDNCANDENIQQYNIIPLGTCESGKIYKSCKNGVVNYNIYKDLQCTQITNSLEVRIGCQYSDSTYTTFINSYCT